MKYTKFVIENFKGINNLTIDFTKQPQGKIFPLVGLNESGKTTILEAINFLQNGCEDEKAHELIHKKNSDNFTGKISVEATLELEAFDKELIDDFLKRNNLKKEQSINDFTYTKKCHFQDSKFDVFFNEIDNVSYYIPLEVKTSKQKKFKKLHKYDRETHYKLANELESKLPKILYFENFLFDFPDKIYLEPVGNALETQTVIQEEYRQVIQDILDSLESGLKLEKHILARAKRDTPSDEAAIAGVRAKMAKKLDETIVQPWTESFNGSQNMTIAVEIGKDENTYFLKFTINQNGSTFFINERSLGFRWLFGYALFTEFRQARAQEKSEYLFLFDEPASNLHQKGQQELLTRFEQLTDKAKIMYSTHSHYLLNSKFLLNSFVVKDNRHNNDISADYAQDITAELYKNFVANHPKEEDHFKPILDVLEFSPTDFDLTDNIVFFEGKFDYYTFKWIQNTYLQFKKFNFKFYPGASVDKYENKFREYIAHNKKFIAIFDADKHGKQAIERYRKDITQELKKHLFTLSDVDKNFDDCTTEKLFNENERLNIQKTSFPDINKYIKSKFNTAIQELFIGEKDFELSADTIGNFKKIFEFIQTQFAEPEINGTD